MDVLNLPEEPETITIVVIEDSALSLKLLTVLLERHGYLVKPFAEGISGLAYIRENPPNLVMLDISMPEMDGYTLCEKLKDDERTKEIPVIFVSSRHEAADKVRAFRCGGIDFISKPFQTEEVIARVRTHLELAFFKKDLESRVSARTQELEALNNAYARFVPMELLEILNKSSITEVDLGDQVHRAMAVMFTDIRDFTSLSETMTPQDNFGFINAYLRRVSPVVRRNGGIVDSYIGDSVMSLFKQEEVDHALRAAIEIRHEVCNYNEHRFQTGRRPLEIGSGIHVGDLMLGIIGEEKRLQGTVISDAVNLASRLESLTRFYGVGIVLSKQTLDLVNDESAFHTRFLGLASVKGKRHPVMIYELYDGDEQETFVKKLDSREDFEMGIYHYFHEEFENAVDYFKKVTAVNIQDNAAWLFLNKANNFLRHGKTTDWVGLENLDDSLPCPR